MTVNYETDAKDREILRLVANSFVSVSEISSRLFMSESTVRRRLSNLENSGFIIRTHGGAILNKNQQLNKNLPLYLRTMQFDEDKKKIAAKAIKLISDGDIIFIDSSSTVLFMLPHLSSFENITVCTNSIKAAAILAELEIQSVFFGGNIISGEMACNSEETFETIRRINADWFFFSCDALSEDGILTDNSKSNCYLRLQYMKNAKKSVLLIDETKLNKKCTYLLGNLRYVDYCICNNEMPMHLINTTAHTVFK